MTVHTFTWSLLILYFTKWWRLLQFKKSKTLDRVEFLTVASYYKTVKNIYLVFQNKTICFHNRPRTPEEQKMAGVPQGYNLAPILYNSNKLHIKQSTLQTLYCLLSEEPSSTETLKVQVNPESTQGICFKLCHSTSPNKGSMVERCDKWK